MALPAESAVAWRLVSGPRNSASASPSWRSVGVKWTLRSVRCAARAWGSCGSRARTLTGLGRRLRERPNSPPQRWSPRRTCMTGLLRCSSSWPLPARAGPKSTYAVQPNTVVRLATTVRRRRATGPMRTVDAIQRLLSNASRIAWQPGVRCTSADGSDRPRSHPAQTTG